MNGHLRYRGHSAGARLGGMVCALALALTAGCSDGGRASPESDVAGPGAGTENRFPPIPEDRQQDVDAMLTRLRAELVAIPAGSFRMGSERGERWERPVRELRIEPFQLAGFELRNRDYGLYAELTGRGNWPGFRFREREDWAESPAAYVSWDDAQLFVAWLRVVDDGAWRLPTEAEWEYAARAGTQTRYWWGDSFEETRGNGPGRHGPDTWESTAPVGRFPPNPWGLHDITGNVAEWVQDCWERSYEGAPADGSAREVAGCDWRVIRGGSWLQGDQMHRSAARYYLAPADATSTQVGFRLAR
jgi:formylglycine-generating enzyme required for sulfatase activity